MRIILASNSPRRKQLLAKIIDNFEIIPSTAPEVTSETEPKQFVMSLARHKATDVWQSHAASDKRAAVVIGCDTVVELNSKILGKPKSRSNALEMLNTLSGKTHNVHTGVCIICGGEIYSFCETTAVAFRELSAQEMAHYVDGGGAMDKAGAYGIQECDFVENYVGSYDNVVGFPTERIAELLRELKII